jgi:hypothetical protein
MTQKIGLGDFIKSMKSSTCCQCGRKVGKNPHWIHLSTSGQILNPNEENPKSQGFFPIGSECAKSFESEILVKN